MKTLISRPTEHDKDVFEGAIDMLLPSVLEWEIVTSEQDMCSDDERKTIRDELIKGIRSSNDKDGYALARSLERSVMWSPDAALVDILDYFGSFLARVHREKVKSWVIKSNIIPQKSIGDSVRVKVRGGEYDGFVLSVDKTTAQYTINIPALGHFKYTFSNGVAIKNDGRFSGTQGIIKPVEEIDD